MTVDVMEHYRRWLGCAREDADLCEELKEMEDHPERMEEAFCRNLEFGTGGLRGEIGAGTNRMNIYTVAKASQGVADHICRHFQGEKRKVAISYDSRIKSKKFAEVTAGVFAANGVAAFIYRELMPTPCLSYAVRYLGCAAGIMITASHNPSCYNGYKVYGEDGCQITTKMAGEILTEIEKLDIFHDVKKMDFEQGVNGKQIRFIPDHVFTSFIEEEKKLSVLAPGEEADRSAVIVYSPLNGTGREPVLRTLGEMGFDHIVVVAEQEMPDGDFPTCPYPNPEFEGAMELGIEYARREDADLVLATDPDCDRVGIVVRSRAGEYVLLSGNETGVLLLDFVCAKRREHGTMPPDPVMMKTIVTTDMGTRIAEHYGLSTVEVLTGFKFIGEQIGLLEQQGKLDSFVFAFEESCGYLSGSFVRDKDGINASLLVCEMFASYKKRGISLWERLEQLHQQYGYWKDTLHSYACKGVDGPEKMKAIMERFRQPVAFFGGKRVLRCMDYSIGLQGLPRSDALKFILEDDCAISVRPSGTEPKLKVYISVTSPDPEKIGSIERRMRQSVEEIIEG